MEDQLSDDQCQKMLQFMATEHSALQAGRSATIFETGGRTTVFLGTPSSTLVALAFVGQISRLGAAFLGSPCTLLPRLGGVAGQQHAGNRYPAGGFEPLP